MGRRGGEGTPTRLLRSALPQEREVWVKDTVGLRRRWLEVSTR
jgi:hypothetical protein